MRIVMLVWLGFLVLTLSGCETVNRIMKESEWPEEKIWQPHKYSYTGGMDYSKRGVPTQENTNNAGWSGIE